MRAIPVSILTVLLALGIAACDPVEPPSAPAAPMPAPVVAPPPAPTPAPAPLPPAPLPVAPERPVRAEPPAAPEATGGRLPLARILAIAARRVPGEVIDVELKEEDDDDPETYELEILTAEDRVIEMVLNARTGAVIEIEED